MKLYHGTSDSVLEAVLKEGLRPVSSGVADEWAKQQGWSVKQGRPSSVYLTTERWLADVYAKRASDVRGDSPVVLVVDVPDSVVKVQDEDDSHGVRLEQAVSCEWVCVA